MGFPRSALADDPLYVLGDANAKLPARAAGQCPIPRSLRPMTADTETAPEAPASPDDPKPPRRPKPTPR